MCVSPEAALPAMFTSRRCLQWVGWNYMKSPGPAGLFSGFRWNRPREGRVAWEAYRAAMKATVRLLSITRSFGLSRLAGVGADTDAMGQNRRHTA